MEFHISEEQRRLQQRSRCLAEDFATRAARHDREASHPVENYEALRAAGFYGLNVPTALEGAGMGLLGYSLAAEELGQGCASTALAFNMHLSIVGPLITRTAMTLGGAHALFKTGSLERLFRNGAVALVQFPPRDFCLASLGLLELGLDPRDVLPPLRPLRDDAGPIIR